MRAGLIVAGGRSTRFGERDKAVADLAGTPMIRRVADRLVPAIDRLIVNCRRDQRDAIEAALSGYDHPVTFAVDDDPDEGPTAGILAGLRALLAEESAADGDAPERDGDPPYAFVVACDMPFVDPDFAAYLFERAAGAPAADEGTDPSIARSRPRDAAVPKLDDGWFQPTHAVYRADTMAAACEAALERGERRVMAPLSDLDYVVVDEAEVRARATLDTFENLNTPEEFEAAAERLRRGESDP